MTFSCRCRFLILFGIITEGELCSISNRILFINKHKLLPVPLTCLPQMCKKVLYFANKHPVVLVFVVYYKICTQLILG